jgi:hypothetical protein
MPRSDSSRRPYLAGGDMIRVVDMEEPRDDVDSRCMTTVV